MHLRRKSCFSGSNGEIRCWNVEPAGRGRQKYHPHVNGYTMKVLCAIIWFGGPLRIAAWPIWSGRERSSHSHLPQVPQIRLANLPIPPSVFFIVLPKFFVLGSCFDMSGSTFGVFVSLELWISLSLRCILVFLRLHTNQQKQYRNPM